LIVSATLPPRRTAPKNSAKEAIITACFKVRTLEPTLVAKPFFEGKERERERERE